MFTNKFYRFIAVAFSLLLLLVTGTLARANQAPDGRIESVFGQHCSVSGWAKDPDYSGSITVQIYRGAPAGQGGVFVGSIIANIPRPDLGNHGYRHSLPVSFTSFDDLIYVNAVGVDANGNPNGQNTSLALFTPSAPSRQLTCPNIGAEPDELARTVDFTQSFGFKTDLSAVAPIMRASEFNITNSPDGHISVDIEGEKSKIFFQCALSGIGKFLSCLSENPSVESFNNLNGLLKDTTGNTARFVMEGSVPGDPYQDKYAAITSTWRDPQTGYIHAWYHAEVFVNRELCGSSGFSAHYATIGYAISTDGGRTFSKQGPVLTSPTARDPNVCLGQGTSEPKVIEVGDYLYMFFDFDQYPNHPNTPASQLGGISVARASKSNPGVWTKYYNGNFSEPGINGQITPVIRKGGSNGNLWLGSTIANAYIGKYVMIHSDHNSQNALFIRTSVDLINWSSPQLLIPPPANWRYWYPTILGRDDNAMGQNGWLYFARFRSPNNFETSLLYRRSISFERTVSDGCNYNLSSNNLSFPKAGGTASVSVTTTGNCGWMSAGNDNWITVTPVGTRFTGNNSISISIAADTGNSARTGTITIAGQTLTITQSAQTPFDFDGDSKSDQAVFRSGIWYLLQSQLGFTGLQFGFATDKITPADFDGDGKTDIAVFRDGVWYLLRSQLGFTAVQFGQANDIPVPADYDGDGKADVAVYRGGIWYILQSQLGFTGFQFGVSTDKPVPADFDGDGKTDAAVYRDGVWYMLRSQLGFTAVQFGIASDKPVVGDYDGDGKADQAVYRSGIWYLLQSTADFTGSQFGIASDIPVAADYDGDGKTDIAVFRDGFWYLLRSQQGFTAVQFGTTNDKAIPAAYVP